MHTLHGVPCPAPAAGHQVDVRALREAWVGVPGVLAQRPEDLSGVQQHGRVEVPQRVHPVLPCGGVPSARARRGDDAGGGHVRPANPHDGMHDRRQARGRRDKKTRPHRYYENRGFRLVRVVNLPHRGSWALFPRAFDPTLGRSVPRSVLRVASRILGKELCFD